jgi:hypothetical protein
MDIAITSKDINNFSKLHFSSTGGKAKKFQDQLEAKHRHLESLENKIKILTFIYDNGLQNTKLKKKSLLSSSMSTFASTKYKK